MKVAVVTAVIGGIDEVKEIPEQTVPFDRYFFTDSNKGLIPGSYPDRMAALYFKTQIYRVAEGDLLIWVDGKIQINSPDFIQQCIDALGNSDLAIMKHHWRSCIYEEIYHILHCIGHGNEYLIERYADKPMAEQSTYWNKLGYPKNNGLNDCCIFIMRPTEKMKAVFSAWWLYVAKKNYFDQTTIQGVCWLLGIQIQPIVFKPGSYSDIPHKVLK